MNILITGGNGMLGSTFKHMQILENIGHTVYYTDSHSLDITSIHQIDSFIDDHKIDLIINCAAYTNVEQAEEDILNYQVNTLGVINLAKICAQKNIKIIHISTDYVFDGTKKTGYLTHDIVGPLNKYGIAKWLGEQCLQTICPTAKIIRTSWLYGGGIHFKNFVNTMIKLSESKHELSIINDQWGAPTYTNDLSNAIAEIITNWDVHQDTIYHFSNITPQGGITRFDFSQEIFTVQNKRITLNPITSDLYPSKAKRPQYSWMINTSTIQLPGWKESLRRYLDDL